MLQKIDLRKLAERQCPERAFVSLYLSSPESMCKIDDRAERVRNFLRDRPEELENFEQSLALIERSLESHTFDSEGLAVFASYALDFFEGYPLDVSPPDLVRVGDCPYIRPLAELQEEYETFVVVAADNSGARVFLVADGTPREEDSVRADVKNRVKVGGWSQKRYQRRRDNELLHYAKEVGEALARLEKEVEFSRVVLLGSAEALREIREQLPSSVAEKVVGEEQVSVKEGEEQLMEEAFRLFFERERQEEADLWTRICGDALAHDLAAIGGEEVWSALQDGRVETIAVIRDVTLPGVHCRECDNVMPGELDACRYCETNGDSLFRLDLVEKLVEQAQLTGASVDFVDPIEGLVRAGNVAALLRY
ncbi:MAG TPA: Vms1/Ankzf1 family peptidyl-tRNA hydrolase [Thermoanaerobaculia bacterium]|nr:Vms1/Ankzf1 family peptidyl-tRNA hydrolase [Thermoanaerobaculia bacterium]